ncbi:MAG: cupin [Ginsengibacter sp.]
MEQYINDKPEIIKYILPGDEQFPNSSLWLLIYKNALTLPSEGAVSFIEKIFESNNWKNSWRNGIYDYHHYHSITHEVLGVYDGAATVQFGGPNGESEHILKGDIIIIPAGVAHKCLEAQSNFKCVGAYPDGNNYDMNYGKPSERPEADENIREVPLPEKDPVYGSQGPLILNWEIQ